MSAPQAPVAPAEPAETPGEDRWPRKRRDRTLHVRLRAGRPGAGAVIWNPSPARAVDFVIEQLGLYPGAITFADRPGADSAAGDVVVLDARPDAARGRPSRAVLAEIFFDPAVPDAAQRLEATRTSGACS